MVAKNQKKVTKVAKAPAVVEAVAVEAATTASVESPLKNNEATLKATQALLEYIKQQRSQASAQPDAKKNLLAGDDEEDVLGAEKEAIYVVFTTKKFLTDRKNLKPKRIAIPHPIYNAQDTSICLFSKDPQRAYKDALLTGQGENKDEPAHASLTRVVGVSKLKGKFKSFEARRALLGQHDLFIAEDNVVTTLPRLLGKTFYESGKSPLSVSLESRGAISAVKAKSEINKILNSTLFTVSPGTYSAIKIGYTTEAFPAEALVANLEAVAEYFSEKIMTNGWNGIRGVHIKTASSTSLPIWATESLYDEEDVAAEVTAESRKRKTEEDNETEGPKMSKLEAALAEVVNAEDLPLREPSKKKAKKAARAEQIEKKTAAAAAAKVAAKK